MKLFYIVYLINAFLFCQEYDLQLVLQLNQLVEFFAIELDLALELGAFGEYRNLGILSDSVGHFPHQKRNKELRQHLQNQVAFNETLLDKLLLKHHKTDLEFSLA